MTTILRLVRFWPPYFGAGVRVVEFAPDLTFLKVGMKLHFWNKNAVGTHFGGSLYAMVDPFYMLILMEHLGREYVVWDKTASIRFRRPGKGEVFATFHLPLEKIKELKMAADSQPKVEPVFQVQVVDADGLVVAEVEKTLYIAKRNKSKSISPN